MSAATTYEFSLDRGRAAADLKGSEEELWPVNAYSDADELNDLLEAAQNAGLISASRQARLFVYPLSIAEPDPLLAIVVTGGPTLLGHELALSGRDGEDPITFTLRLLEQVVVRGNAVLAEALADSAALDRIAAYMNRPGPWNGGDVCEVVARELEDSGRDVLDNADD
jgi:hypothetical protein